MTPREVGERTHMLARREGRTFGALAKFAWHGPCAP